MHGRTLTLLLGLAALLTSTAPAFAGGSEQRSSFKISVSGTYRSSGDVTNTECLRPDPATGEAVTYTATGKASESTSFSTTRAARFDVSRTKGHSRVFGGGFPVPVRARMTRSSDLDETTHPKGCRLNDHPLPKNCGTKTKPYKLSVYLRRAGGFSFNFSNGFSTERPEDPFSCPLPDGAHWFGQTDPPPVTIPASKLFRRSLSRLSISGSRTRTLHPSSEGYSAVVTETFTWTVSLRRLS